MALRRVFKQTSPLILDITNVQKVSPSPSQGWANLLILFGGDDRDRTDGLSLAKAALSNSKYPPIQSLKSSFLAPDSNCLSTLAHLPDLPVCEIDKIEAGHHSVNSILQILCPSEWVQISGFSYALFREGLSSSVRRNGVLAVPSLHKNCD
jgi:hypothetical protein